MRIALIGNGNLAWHLSEAFRAAGQAIHAHLVHTPTTDLGWNTHHTWDTMPGDIDMYLLAIPDGAITEVSKRIAPHKCVVHFSGGTSMNAIVQESRAVCWPIQTLTRGTRIDYFTFPVLFECSNDKTTNFLQASIMKVWGNWIAADNAQRMAAHMAAVIANNFTNHLQHIARQLLSEAALPTQLLQPMLHAHARLLDTYEPEQLQTGPAKRHDLDTIQRHIHLLQPHSDWKKLYEQLSEDIITTYPHL